MIILCVVAKRKFHQEMGFHCTMDQTTESHLAENKFIIKHIRGVIRGRQLRNADLESKTFDLASRTVRCSRHEVKSNSCQVGHFLHFVILHSLSNR